MKDVGTQCIKNAEIARKGMKGRGLLVFCARRHVSEKGSARRKAMQSMRGE